MIKYDKLWETMAERNISQYALINKYGISSGQINRLKHNQSVNINTLNRLCNILNCSTLDEVAEFIPDSNNIDVNPPTIF